MKDKVELWLNKQVYAGKISLENAHEQIRTNWMNLYREKKGLSP